MSDAPPMDLASLADAVTVRLDKACKLLAELQSADFQTLDAAKVRDYAQTTHNLIADAHRLHFELWKKAAKAKQS